ncbi:hypothetical protein Y1Q_0014076 [Alligator mississippiensis]|uniref:Uncharacterized protein n=1 Tax=Alligator mississippiensis TaxID=8496 RepID=A0A151MJY7_ALLMI|nr:hypothetical protein Y1Q_0014076 [Alligator mississippiensis]
MAVRSTGSSPSHLPPQSPSYSREDCRLHSSKGRLRELPCFPCRHGGSWLSTPLLWDLRLLPSSNSPRQLEFCCRFWSP